MQETCISLSPLQLIDYDCGFPLSAYLWLSVFAVLVSRFDNSKSTSLFQNITCFHN